MRTTTKSKTNDGPTFSVTRMADMAIDYRLNQQFAKMRKRITSQARTGQHKLVTTKYVHPEVVGRIASMNFIVDQEEFTNKFDNSKRVRTTIRW